MNASQFQFKVYFLGHIPTIRLANNDLSTDLLNFEGSSGAREGELREREVMPR